MTRVSIKVVLSCMLIVACLLPGCGASYNLKVTNKTPTPVEIRLVDVWYGGDEGYWLETTCAPDSTFQYSMADGWRSEGKWIHVYREGATADGPDLKLRIHQPWGNQHVLVTDDEGRVVCK